MEAVRSKTNYNHTQWQQSPWTTHEKPDWFTLSPPSPKIYKKKNLLSFIFSSPQKQNYWGALSQLQSERLKKRTLKSPVTSQHRPFSYTRAAYYKYHWVNKEFLFAMNKLSIVSMIVGLMFLGALFFISGFLLAINLYVSGPHLPTLKTVSEIPNHRASAHALKAAHRPTPPSATVAQQYASVGGVSMVPPSHKPTQSVAPTPLYPQPQPPIYNSANPTPYLSQTAPSTNYSAPNYPSPYPASSYSQPVTNQGQPLPSGSLNHQYAAHPYPPSQYSPGPSIVVAPPYQ